MKAELSFVYKEIGRMQGLSFYETDFKARNRQFYKQECISALKNENKKVQLTEAFSPRLSEDIRRKMVLYECMETQEDRIYRSILQGKIRTGGQNITFRQKQKNEKCKERYSPEYSLPMPEQIPEQMRNLELYWEKTSETDDIIKAGLMAYQFFMILPYEEDNEIWISILLNLFLRQQELGTDYYIPFARYFAEQETERKAAMRDAEESGDYSAWIHFFTDMTGQAVARTNQAIMQLEQIRRDTLYAVENEKQKSLLHDVFSFMEKNPIFVIQDIEQEFHTAYNTAAKSVAILEKHDLVKEISNKQRYRVYCYERYIRELLK